MRLRLFVCAAIAGAIACGPTLPACDGAAAAALPRAVINVSVATLWTAPNQLRPVDAPSATNPVNIPAWLAGMSSSDREWLVGRVQTQALYGTVVTILQQQGAWTQVAVEGQPTPLNSHGYPGWLPTRQLTRNMSLVALRATHSVAIVAARTTWLRDSHSLVPRLQISFATRLVVLGRTGNFWLVATPTGGKLVVSRAAVAVYRSMSAVPKPSGSRILATAKMFLGLPYLWGGTSGFGFDCSGLTHTVYARYGIVIPRDADRQAARGVPVSRAQASTGDLFFFAGQGGEGFVHHVAIYAGQGQMLHAPRPGTAVMISPVSSMGSEYAGARRYR